MPEAYRTIETGILDLSGLRGKGEGEGVSGGEG